MYGTVVFREHPSECQPSNQSMLKSPTAEIKILRLTALSRQALNLSRNISVFWSLNAGGIYTTIIKICIHVFQM